MQPTRKLILDYLKEHGQATVDELAQVLELTSVTVRHHLDILRGEGLVSDPVIKHRTTPGRPQYVFELTAKASGTFPKNYQAFAQALLAEVKAGGGARPVNVIFEGMAYRIAKDAPTPQPNEPWPQKLNRAITFLNEQGYVARWEAHPEGYLLSTCNCPYDALTAENPEVCSLDMALLRHLLGTTPECLHRQAEGAGQCSFLIRP